MKTGLLPQKDTTRMTAALAVTISNAGNGFIHQ